MIKRLQTRWADRGGFKAAGTLIGAATGDAITDSQAEAVRAIPKLCRMRKAHDILATNDTALEQQILAIAPAERKADIHQHRQHDHLPRGVELAEQLAGSRRRSIRRPYPLQITLTCICPGEPTKNEGRHADEPQS